MTNPHESIHPDTKENPQFNYPHFGLTKREYFASMAMQGLLSNSPDWNDSDHCLNWVAESSVKFSDALIEVLNKTEK
jgi:hypothetical protein